MKMVFMTLVLVICSILSASELSPGRRIHVQCCGSTVYMTVLPSFHDCGMSMIPPPNSIMRKRMPAVGSIQNPRWSNYKDSDYRKSRKSRPKLTLELNFYKKKK